MIKNRREQRGMEAVEPVLRQVVLSASLEMGTCLRELVLAGGLQVFAAMLEDDVTALCGRRHARVKDRSHSRHGGEQVAITFGGRKITVRKPRVRSVGEESSEERLPTWEALSGIDPLGERALEQMLLGVTTRKYGRSLERMPASIEVSSTSKSSVSRRFVALTKRKMVEFLGRSLAEEDYVVVMIDGMTFGDHVVVTAMGITWDGRKHILGCREGSTENGTVCRALLADLVERGLTVDRPRLFVIDGAKALRSAIRSVFGASALIQRCQIHKVNNVLGELPERKHEWVRKTMGKAFDAATSKQAQAILKRLASTLEEQHPSAAGSLREGLEELFTVNDLGATGWLWRTLRSTNTLESANEKVRRLTRNVKRYRSGSMALRWAVTGYMAAESAFRRIKGHQDLPGIVSRIEQRVRKLMGDETSTRKDEVA